MSKRWLYLILTFNGVIPLILDIAVISIHFQMLTNEHDINRRAVRSMCLPICCMYKLWRGEVFGDLEMDERKYLIMEDKIEEKQIQAHAYIHIHTHVYI